MKHCSPERVLLLLIPLEVLLAAFAGPPRTMTLTPLRPANSCTLYFTIPQLERLFCSCRRPLALHNLDAIIVQSSLSLLLLIYSVFHYSRTLYVNLAASAVPLRTMTLRPSSCSPAWSPSKVSRKDWKNSIGTLPLKLDRMCQTSTTALQNGLRPHS